MSVPTLVNSIFATTAGSSTSITCAAVHAGDSALPGDLLVLAVLVPGGVPASSVTDTKGNTWSLGKAQTWPGTGPFSMSMEVWYCVPTITLTSSDTVTVVMSGTGANKGITIAHFVNVGGTPFDKVQGQFVPGGTTSLSSGASAATTQAEEVVIGIFGVYTSGGNSLTPGGVYSQISNNTWGTGSPLTLLLEYKTVTVTGAQTATATATSTPGEYHAVVITFKGITTKIPGGISAGSGGITQNKIFVKTLGAISAGATSIDKLKRYPRQPGGISAGATSISYTRQYVKAIGGISAGASSAGGHTLLRGKIIGGAAVGASGAAKGARFGKNTGGISAGFGALFRGSRAYVTYVDFVIPTAADFSFTKNLGGVSPGAVGIPRVINHVKTVGGISAGAANVTKGTIQQIKTVGGASAASSTAVRQTQASKIAGGISRPIALPSRTIVYVRASGGVSAGFSGLTRAIRASKSSGGISAAQSLSAPGQNQGKTVGGISAGASGIDTLKIAPRSLGGISGATAAVQRANRGVVTWIRFEIPMAISSTFSKNIGGTSGSTGALVHSAVHSYGAISSTTAGITKLTGLSGPWPAAPFTYTLNPIVQKTLGGISPAAGGISKVQTIGKTVGAGSAGAGGISKTYAVQRVPGGISAGAASVTQTKRVIRTLGAQSFAQANIDRQTRSAKTYGGISAGASGLASKLATYPKTYGGISAGRANIDEIHSAPFTKVFGGISAGAANIARSFQAKKTVGGISAGATNISKFAQSTIKTYGAASPGRASISVRSINTNAGGISAGVGGFARTIVYSRALGGISASTGGMSRIIRAVHTVGGISTGSTSSTFRKLQSKNLGGISGATAAIDEFTLVLGFSKLVGGVSASTGGVNRGSITVHNGLGAVSAGRAGISYFETGNLKKTYGARSSASGGIQARHLFAILPDTKIDYLLLSAEIEAGPEYGSNEVVLLSAEVYE